MKCTDSTHSLFHAAGDSIFKAIFRSKNISILVSFWANSQTHSFHIFRMCRLLKIQFLHILESIKVDINFPFLLLISQFSRITVFQENFIKFITSTFTIIQFYCVRFWMLSNYSLCIWTYTQCGVFENVSIYLTVRVFGLFLKWESFHSDLMCIIHLMNT